MRRRPALPVAAPAVSLALVLALALSACAEEGTVDLAFRPGEGEELQYTTEVESATATEVSCQPPRRTQDTTTVHSTQRVLDVGEGGARVEVVLSRPGIGSRSVVVRYDRAAQLTSVEEVEGIPASALGELGLSEVFPPAAGAPPDRPLSPGDRWAVDDEVVLGPETAPTRLRGAGRLVALGVEDGRETATVETATTLPVSSTTVSSTGTRTLDGTQSTDVVVTYDLADGSVVRASSVTTASYSLVLGPPPGGGGDPCSGTLSVEVRSRVRRVG